MNITARPTSGSSARAAFSCSITPDENLTTIQWFFEPMEFGSRMGPSMMVESGFLTSGVIGVANVTIVGGLADPGTSILVLDRVGNDREGLYSCVATFSDGRMINSSSGALIYNGEKLLCWDSAKMLIANHAPFLPSFPLFFLVTEERKKKGGRVIGRGRGGVKKLLPSLSLVSYHFPTLSPSFSSACHSSPYSHLLPLAITPSLPTCSLNMFLHQIQM